MGATEKVAVIGAGAAGLPSARQIALEGLEPVIFEAETRLGGTWVYTEDLESDSPGRDPDRHRVHTSMYADLRTNLLRDRIAFREFPFECRVENLIPLDASRNVWFDRGGEPAGVAQRYFLQQGDAQFSYNDELARRSGVEPLPPSFKQVYKAVEQARFRDPETYRDKDFPWVKTEVEHGSGPQRL